MEFRSEIKKVELLRPALGFELAAQPIEYRYDPLTGFESRVNVTRAGRVRQVQGDTTDVAELVGHTADGCVFCPQNIEERTPRFPPGFSVEGRIKRGECTLFPNLYPFAEHHAVATLAERHHLGLDEFTAGMVADNVTASLEYISIVHRTDAGARYPVWIWNHLPPSGASIVHPHVQVVVDRVPMAGIEALIAASDEYYRQQGSNYWRELVDVERKDGERYIGENDSLGVIASFSPRGNREVQLIFKEACCLLDLDDGRIADFADAIVRVLRCYKQMGVNSFNLITLSAPLCEQSKHYRLSARMISRPAFQPLYTNDSGPLERFLGVSVIETLPEDVAKIMKPFFST
jgi:UDPglucose--hexose-1-phosphate uridylyltransferase